MFVRFTGPGESVPVGCRGRQAPYLTGFRRVWRRFPPPGGPSARALARGSWRVVWRDRGRLFRPAGWRDSLPSRPGLRCRPKPGSSRFPSPKSARPGCRGPSPRGSRHARTGRCSAACLGRVRGWHPADGSPPATIGGAAVIQRAFSRTRFGTRSGRERHFLMDSLGMEGRGPPAPEPGGMGRPGWGPPPTGPARRPLHEGQGGASGCHLVRPGVQVLAHPLVLSGRPDSRAGAPSASVS